MKRGRRILLILMGCGVVAFTGALMWPREREPVYQGKRLSEWLGAYELGYVSVTEQRFADNEKEAASNAIRNLGTNCLPWLVRWIGYEPPALRDRFRGILWKLPMSIRLRLWEGDRLSMDAVEGFRILGRAAGPAVPELARLMNDGNRKASRLRAMHALKRVGEEGFPPLLAVLNKGVATNPLDDFTVTLDILDLFRDGVDISPAVPAMLLIDRESRKYVSNLVDFAYRHALAEKPSFLIPALTNCLSDPRSGVRSEAVRWIGLMGDRAVGAVPTLKGMLTDPERSVREEATNAVQRIAPDDVGGD